MLGINLNNVEAAGGNRPGAGGYVIEIVRVVNVASKEYIEFEYDFAEGKYQGYYHDLKNRKGWWGGTFRKYYTEKSRPFFLKFMEQIEEYNNGAPGLIVEVENEEGETVKDVDETKLPGKKIGMVVGLEKYYGNDGKLKTRFDHFGAVFCDPDQIRSGDFEVPELKKADSPAVPPTADVVDTTMGPSAIGDDDMPF